MLSLTPRLCVTLHCSVCVADDCGGTNWPQANDSWTRFRDGFEQYYGDKPIPVISVEYCSDPTQCGLWIADTANMARSTGDIQATFGSILSNADLNSKMAPAQTCTYFADPDMLELDAPGVSFNQSAVQLGLWSIMGSPLGLSTDIRFLSPAYLALMTNQELIAIDQDAVCKQGSKVIDNGSSSTQAWARSLSNGDVAVALLNRGTSVASLTADFKSLGVTTASASVRDVLNNKDLPDAAGSISSGLGPTSLVLYRLTPKA
jgi:alpha-galactosidase